MYYLPPVLFILLPICHAVCHFNLPITAHKHCFLAANDNMPENVVLSETYSPQC